MLEADFVLPIRRASIGDSDHQDSYRPLLIFRNSFPSPPCKKKLAMLKKETGGFLATERSWLLPLWLMLPWRGLFTSVIHLERTWYSKVEVKKATPQVNGG